jgi:hypothetical protein
VKQPGAHRLEAWLEIAGERRVWIYSNPIRVVQAARGGSKAEEGAR